MRVLGFLVTVDVWMCAGESDRMWVDARGAAVHLVVDTEDDG
jgi:hypothetical protein